MYDHKELDDLCGAAERANTPFVIVPIGKLRALLRNNAYLKERFTEMSGQQPPSVV